jgi:3'-5' exonuclease
MLRIFLDIETLPEDRGKLANYPKLCNCNEEEFRRLALSGDHGQVLSVGVIVEYDGKVIQSGCLGRDRQTMLFHLEERRTLLGFWKLLKSFNPRRDLIVTFNGLSFDLPFLYKRSYANRVKPSVELSFARYRSQPIYDVLMEWNKWDYRARFVSLDELAKILGLESSKTEEIDGGQVYDRFCEGAHELIAAYCMADVHLTRRIYYRLVQPEGPEPEL